MFTSIIQILGSVIAQAFGWFTVLCDSMDAVGVIVGFLSAIMVMIASYRFLLAPIIGGRHIASIGGSVSDGSYPSSLSGRDFGGNAPYFDKETYSRGHR